MESVLLNFAVLVSVLLHGLMAIPGTDGEILSEAGGFSKTFPEVPIELRV